MARPKKYRQWLLQVMDEVYHKNESPIKADYEKAVANAINKTLDDPTRGYTSRQIHSNISRAIDDLVKDNIMLTDNTHYYPNNDEYRRRQVRNELIRNVKFEKKEAKKISDNTFVLILKAEENYNHCVHLIESFISKEHYFYITAINNVIFVILNDSTELNTIIDRFSELFKDIAVFEQKELEKAKKIEREHDPFRVARKKARQAKKESLTNYQKQEE